MIFFKKGENKRFGTWSLNLLCSIIQLPDKYYHIFLNFSNLPTRTQQIASYWFFKNFTCTFIYVQTTFLWCPFFKSNLAFTSETTSSVHTVGIRSEKCKNIRENQIFLHAEPFCYPVYKYFVPNITLFLIFCLINITLSLSVLNIILFVLFIQCYSVCDFFTQYYSVYVYCVPDVTLCMKIVYPMFLCV